MTEVPSKLAEEIRVLTADEERQTKRLAGRPRLGSRTHASESYVN
jgi:hypothetical protein